MCIWPNPFGMEALLGGRVDSGTGQLHEDGLARPGGLGRADRLPKWLLRTRFRDPSGNDSFAGRPHAQPELAAEGTGEVSAPGRRCGNPDSGGFLTWDLDAPGGTDCGDFHRETDFNFVLRLMEEEGIAYFFEHHPDSNKHILVL